MTKELSDLQAKYIAGVDTMEERDVRRYLDLLTQDYSAEYREQRIKALVGRTKVIERLSRAEQRAKDEHAYLMECSRKVNVIMSRWSEQGAVKRYIGDGYCEILDFEGHELYRMYGALSTSGKPIYDVLADVERIDKEVFGEVGAE